MKIYIGCDHGGFELKEKLKKYLETKGCSVEDMGTNSTDSVDYPEFGHKVGVAVVENSAKGIVICGTGIGISIAANKVEGVRAALCHCKEYAELTRQHNDANVLALGGRFLTFDEAVEITETFLNTDFEGGRHLNRVKKIEL